MLMELSDPPVVGRSGKLNVQQHYKSTYATNPDIVYVVPLVTVVLIVSLDPTLVYRTT